jgi:hypothetical protein
MKFQVEKGCRVYMLVHDGDDSTMLVGAGASWPLFIRTTYCSITVYHYVFYLAARRSPIFTE